MICPNCQSNRVVKNGSNKVGTQQFKCKNCKKNFTGNNIGRPKHENDVLISLPFVFYQTLKSIAIKKNLTPSQYLQDILTKESEE